MRFRLAFVFSLLATGALAQNGATVKQSGNVTPNTVPWWITNGVIGGGVTSADSPVSSFGVTNNGFNGICANSDRITAAGRNTICIGTKTNGPSQITVQNYGTATPQPFQFVVNGTTITPGGGIGGLTVGNTTISGGSANCLLYDPSSVLGCTTALPNGTTATTQATNDNTTAVATDAFVQAQLGTGYIKGPVTSAIGNVPLWNNITGTLESDSGVSGVYKQPVSYPSNITSGHFFCAADSDCQFGNAWSQYPLGSVSTNPILIAKAGSSIGSSTLGQTFKIVFTSTGFAGSPITITYTAVGGDTTTTIAAGLCALVNANTTLHNAFGQPIFCQPATSGGLFNLQYIASFSATGATPLTTATTGSTGTITLASETNALDYEILQLGRNVSGRAGAIGDGVYAIQFNGQDSTGTYNTTYASITAAISAATAGSTRGKLYFNTAGGAEAVFDKGLAFFDASGIIAAGGTLGLGTINLPATGSFFIADTCGMTSSALYVCGGNAFGGVAAGSTLNLQSTQSGSPSGDFVQITTGGAVRWKWQSSGEAITTNIAAPSTPATGKVAVWPDSTDLRLHDKNSAGTIGTTVVASTAPSNQFANSVSAAGVVGYAQPSIGNLANIANNTFVGNQSGGSGPPLALTVAQASAMFTKPTVQAFTSGTNATYTTPANATWLEIEFMGGGGGGAGSGTSPGAAVAGGNTCWNTSGTACSTPLYQATGGALGTTAGAASAGGGIAGSLSCNDNQTGGSGEGASGVAAQVGGQGGTSRYGAGGAGGTIAGTGQALVAANSGAGGGGAGVNATGNTGGGGAGGGWCYAIIPSPSGSYVYTIGAAGAAGTAGVSGFNGAAGAAGKIRVIEHYN